jgi:hypothetical protein
MASRVTGSSPAWAEAEDRRPVPEGRHLSCDMIDNEANRGIDLIESLQYPVPGCLLLTSPSRTVRVDVRGAACVSRRCCSGRTR